MQSSIHSPQSQMLVACLCADWCGTCREYRSLFDQLQAQFPQARFLWVDIEDDSDLVDPVDVEDFPTLLIATPAGVHFFGPVMPHLETAQRLIEAHLVSGAQALSPSPERDDLARRLREHSA